MAGAYPSAEESALVWVLFPSISLSLARARLASAFSKHLCQSSRLIRRRSHDTQHLGLDLGVIGGGDAVQSTARIGLSNVLHRLAFEIVGILATDVKCRCRGRLDLHTLGDPWDSAIFLSNTSEVEDRFLRGLDFLALRNTLGWLLATNVELFRSSGLHLDVLGDSWCSSAKIDALGWEGLHSLLDIRATRRVVNRRCLGGAHLGHIIGGND